MKKLFTNPFGIIFIVQFVLYLVILFISPSSSLYIVGASTTNYLNGAIIIFALITITILASFVNLKPKDDLSNSLRLMNLIATINIFFVLLLKTGFDFSMYPYDARLQTALNNNFIVWTFLIFILLLFVIFFNSHGVGGFFYRNFLRLLAYYLPIIAFFFALSRNESHEFRMTIIVISLITIFVFSTAYFAAIKFDSKSFFKYFSFSNLTFSLPILFLVALFLPRIQKFTLDTRFVITDYFIPTITTTFVLFLFFKFLRLGRVENKFSFKYFALVVSSLVLICGLWYVSTHIKSIYGLEMPTLNFY